MTNALEELLARLQAEPSEAGRLWLTLEHGLNAQPEVVQNAVWAAAIPHWFDESFLAALLGDEEIARLAAVDGWATLLKQSYVEPFPGHGYNVHERSRDVLLDRLWRTEPDRFRELSRRAAAYCNAQDQADPAWTIERIYHFLISDPDEGADQLTDMGWEWQNSPNFAYDLVEALARAAREHVDAGRLEGRGRAWTHYWEAHLDVIYNRFRSAEERLALIDLAPETDPYLQATRLAKSGDVHLRLAEYEAARARYEEARPVYAGIGDRLGEANTIQALGDVHLQLAEYEAARARYEEARPIYASIGDRLGEANTLQALGHVHLQLAEYEAARARYEEARPIYAGIGDRLGEANTIKALGELAGELEQEAVAIQLLEAAAAVFRELGLPAREASCFNSMASVIRGLKRHEDTLRYYDRAIATYPEAWLYRNRADTLIELERYDEAARVLDTAEEMQPGQPYALFHRGRIALWTNQAADAVALLEKAVEMRPLLNSFHCQLAYALLAAGDTDRALAEFEQALELTHARKDLVDTEEELARLSRAYGDLPGLDRLAERLRRALEEAANH